MTSKRISTFLCALCLFATGGFYDSRAFAQWQYRLRSGGFGADAASSWPVYVAQEKGFLAKEGIQLDFARSYEQMMALLGGSFDIIADGVSTTTLAAEKGADILVVYELSRRPSQFIALGRGIKALSELEGKTIGIGRVGTVPHLLLKKYLAKNAVDINKINFRLAGGSHERFAALYTGQISATLLSDAYAFRAQQEGMQITAMAKDLVFPWTYIVLRKSWAKANSDIVIRFVRGIYRATLWSYDPANFEGVVRTLTPITRFDQKTMTWALKSAIGNKVHNFERPDTGVLQLAVGWLVSERMLSKPFDAATVIDTQYYDQAVK